MNLNRPQSDINCPTCLCAAQASLNRCHRTLRERFTSGYSLPKAVTKRMEDYYGLSWWESLSSSQASKTANLAKWWRSVDRFIAWVQQHGKPSASKAPENRKGKRIYELGLRLAKGYKEGQLQCVPARGGVHPHELLDQQLGEEWRCVTVGEARSLSNALKLVAFQEHHQRLPELFDGGHLNEELKGIEQVCSLAVCEQSKALCFTHVMSLSLSNPPKIIQTSLLLFYTWFQSMTVCKRVQMYAVQGCAHTVVRYGTVYMVRYGTVRIYNAF